LIGDLRARGIYHHPLEKTIRDAVLDASGREADRVRDRRPGRVPVGDHREAAQPQKVGAAVRVGVEPRAEPPGGGPDQQAAELAARAGGDLLPERVEQLLDRPLEQLERDVAGEPVANHDVGGEAQELPRLHVAGEVEPGLSQERVSLERELVALLVLLADREQAHLGVAAVEDLLGEDGAHVRELDEVLGARVGMTTAMAGRWTPLIRRMCRRPAASIAPVLPAETTASARPSPTSRLATTSELSGLPRTASAGFSSIPIRSGASTSSRPCVSRPGGPTSTGSRPGECASSAPATISSGARSPPIASTATRTKS
jgi:hypothetical protein